MAVDYDRSRTDASEEALKTLPGRRDRGAGADTDADDNDTAESFELPGADLSGEELTVRVVPRRSDEFTCMRCFLVQHRSQLATSSGNELICRDCAD